MNNMSNMNTNNKKNLKVNRKNNNISRIYNNIYNINHSKTFEIKTFQLKKLVI